LNELHLLFLCHEISELRLGTYRVSHGKEKIMRAFFWLLNCIIAQFVSATIVELTTVALVERRRGALTWKSATS
jgi:hypothetical protein